MRRRVGMLAFVGVLVAGSALPAQQSPSSYTTGHRAAVQRLLEASRVRETIEHTAEMMMSAQAKQLAAAPRMKAVLEEFYKEQLDWKVLEPEYTLIYLETYTESEANEMEKFYRTPLGKLILDKAPILMAKTQEVSSARIQRAMPELMKRMQAATEP